MTLLFPQTPLGETLKGFTFLTPFLGSRKIKNHRSFSPSLIKYPPGPTCAGRAPVGRRWPLRPCTHHSQAAPPEATPRVHQPDTIKAFGYFCALDKI